MKSFMVFAAVLACAYARPGLLLNGLGLAAAPVAAGTIQYTSGLAAPIQLATGQIQYAAGQIQYAASPIQYAAAPAIIAPAVTKTQYHAQDELGQVSHGYAHPGQAAAEVRDAFGNVRGSYAYIDPNGKEVRVNYVSDAVNGFRVESNALPVAPEAPAAPALVPVTETPEVAQARAEHAKAVAKAAAAAAAAPAAAVPALIASGPVTETPEVAQARAEHAKAVAEAAAAAAAAPEEPAHIIAGPVAYSAAPIALSAGPIATPVAIAAPAVAFREATLTKVVNNPGHAISYSVA